MFYFCLSQICVRLLLCVFKKTIIHQEYKYKYEQKRISDSLENIQTQKLLDCIAQGIGGEDAWDTIAAGDLGFCRSFDSFVKEKDIIGKVENGVLILTLPIDRKKSLERTISLN